MAPAMEENKDIRTSDEEIVSVDDESSDVSADAENETEEEIQHEPQADEAENSDENSGGETNEDESKEDAAEKTSDFTDPEEEPAEKKKRSKVWISLAGAAAALAVAVGGFAAYVNNYQNVYPNVYVGDTNFGGKNANEVKTLIDAQYKDEKLKGQEMQFRCVDSDSTILMDNMSIHFENDKTVGDVFGYGRNGSLPVKVWSFLSALINKNQIEPAISYDEQSLQGAINDITAPYEVEPVGYTFKITDGKLTIFKPTDGIKVNREQITDIIESRITNYAFGRVEMIPEPTKPPKLNMDEFYAQITSDAVDASYRKTDGHVEVVPEKLKCNIDRDSVESAVRVIKGGEDSFEMAAETIPPAVVGADLTKQLYSEVLGSYKTNFGGSSASRAGNIRLAATRINGTELMPGEEFSYDKAILPRNPANGYMPAPVYVGNQSAMGYGGGICQASSTLYSAALYANLGVLERHNHSMSVGYIPPGMDATISEGVLDLKLKNTTDYPVKIDATAEGGVITMSILGYNPEKYSVDILRSAGGGAYHVTRVVKKDGVEVGREKMPSSAYQPHAPKKKPTN